MTEPKLHADSTILPGMLFKGDASDIRTRIVLQNEIAHPTPNPGMAGKVGLIGAFPSNRSDVIAVRSYPEFLSAYKATGTKQQELEYNGLKAIQYLFMNDYPDVAGATSVTCVNINTGEYVEENSLTVELYENLNSQTKVIDEKIEALTTRISQLENKSNKTEAEQAELDNLKAQRTNYQNIKTELSEITELFDSDVPNLQSNTLLTCAKLQRALHQLADEDIDLLFISADVWDCVVDGQKHGGKLGGKTVTCIGQVYEYILDFIDNKFSNHQPLSYIGWIRTEPAYSATDYTQFGDGIGSKIINVYGGKDNNIDIKIKLIEDIDKREYNFEYPTVLQGEECNKNWGAYQIAQMFTKPTNELSTCGLFYQGGTLRKGSVTERVSQAELAAHICGWIAGMNVSRDLTYQTIPGLVSIDEEAFFGPGDAGEVLNNFGIQVIKPKNRLEKTFFINNSVNPSGWHTNHIRSVNYLLKRYAFEAGLGINNYSSNLAIFRASLENINKEVLNEVDVIRSVSIGQITVINNYHIYVPIDIILAGVVTKISVGVSMTLDETGEYGNSKTTTGYNFYY